MSFFDIWTFNFVSTFVTLASSSWREFTRHHYDRHEWALWRSSLSWIGFLLGLLDIAIILSLNTIKFYDVVQVKLALAYPLKKISLILDWSFRFCIFFQKFLNLGQLLKLSWHKLVLWFVIFSYYFAR